MNKILVYKFKTSNNRKEKTKYESIAKHKIYKLLNLPIDKIIKTEYGKPHIPNYPSYFNISHSSSYIACINSEYECGIDIEVKRDIKSINLLKKKLFNTEDEVSKDNIIKRFTIIEAYLKYIGIGLVNDLINIDIDETNNIIHYKNYKMGYYKTYNLNDIIITVVTEKEINLDLEDHSNEVL